MSDQLKQSDDLIYKFDIEFVDDRKYAAYPQNYRDKKGNH